LKIPATRLGAGKKKQKTFLLSGAPVRENIFFPTEQVFTGVFFILLDRICKPNQT